MTTTMESNDAHTPTPDDVFAVRGELVHHMPPEIADVILNEARYWPKLAIKFHADEDTGKMVRARHREKYISAEVLILTPMLVEWIGAEVPVKIREVRFKVESHDQGWCGEDANLPPYASSWTWFEAVIIRDPRHTTSDPEADALIKSGLSNSRREREPEPSVISVRNPHAPVGPWEDVWDIQRNVRASNIFRSHEVRWGPDNEDAPSGTPGSDGMTGKGSGYGFVDALRMGDRVAVMARAMYPSWANYVKNLELEVYYSV